MMTTTSDAETWGVWCWCNGEEAWLKTGGFGEPETFFEGTQAEAEARADKLNAARRATFRGGFKAMPMTR